MHDPAKISLSGKDAVGSVANSFAVRHTNYSKAEGGPMKAALKAISYVAILAILALAPAALAQASKLVGVWKITEATAVSQSDQNQKPTEIKNPRPGIIIFTRNHFSWVDNHGEPLPDLQEKNPDLAYFGTAFNQLTAFSGTYDVKGSSIMAPVIVSKMPGITRETSTLDFDFKFEGDTLVLIWHAPQKYLVTFKLGRLE
jgi:hypothetical protein